MNRIERLREEISRRRLKAFLVTSIKNIRYLTGFTGSAAVLLVTESDLHLFTDFRYREQALSEAEGCEVIVPAGSLIGALKRRLRRLLRTSAGFEMSAPYQFYHSIKNGFRLRPVRDMVESLRACKEAEEVEKIKEAVRRAEDAFLRVKGYIRRGGTERAIALRLEEALKRNGCNRLPFDIIVASGERAALPHAGASQRRLKNGDMVVIDWGGECDGYYSDMTRTFLLRGTDTARKKRIYRVVLRANREAIGSVREGVHAREIDGVARGIIKREGFGDYFGHGAGHGIGLDIHEAPRISWMSDDTVRKGMVFTIEPGVYITGLGGVRIEDMVHISEDGTRVLTGLPKRLEIIG